MSEIITIKKTRKPRKKKVGRKPWGTNESKAVRILDANKIVDYTITGAPAITSEENIAAWVKPNSPLSIQQACLEVGMDRMLFYYYRDTVPALKEKHVDFKANRRELLKDKSEDKIYEALHWKLNITDKDILDTAKWMSEKTDKAYNPKVEIEQKSIALNFDLSIEDMESQLLDLIRK